jgi:hypothetical protein
MLHFLGGVKSIATTFGFSTLHNWSKSLESRVGKDRSSSLEINQKDWIAEVQLLLGPSVMFPNCKPNVKIKHITSNDKKSVAHFEIGVLDYFSKT